MVEGDIRDGTYGQGGRWGDGARLGRRYGSKRHGVRLVNTEGE